MHNRSTVGGGLAGITWRTLLAVFLTFSLAVPTASALATEPNEGESTSLESPPPDSTIEDSASVQDAPPLSDPTTDSPEISNSPEPEDVAIENAPTVLGQTAPLSSTDPDMKLNLSWDSSMFTSDTVASDNDTALVRSTSSRSTIILKYTLHIQLNAAEFKKDEAEIRIPSVLGNYRNGSAVTLNSSNIGLGTDPDKATESVPFYYFIDSSTKECVIRNAFDLSRAAQAHIEIAYSVDPVSVIDESHAEITAQGVFPDGSGGTKAVTSAETLKYTLDTKIELDNVTLRSEMLYYWPSTLASPDKTYLPPAMDTSQYRYVKYTANAKSPYVNDYHEGNQIYNLAMKLIPDAGGAVVYQYFSSTWWREASFDQSTNTISLDGTEPIVRSGNVLAGTGTSQFIFVVAYPKNQAVNSYTASLEGTAIPGDHIDPPTSSRTQDTLSWQDYEFTYPPGSIFNFSKESKSIGAAALDLLDAREDATGLAFSLSADAQYYPKENDPNFPGVVDPMRIGKLITDDLLYLSPDSNSNNTTARRQLTEDDYYISSATLSLDNTLTDRSSGQTITPDLATEYPGAQIQVSFMVRGNSAWTAADSYPITKNTTLRIPANAYRIRVDVPSVLKDKTRAVLNINHVIRGTSPTYRTMRGENEAAQKLYLFNYAGGVATASNGTITNLPTESSYTVTAKTLGIPDFDIANYNQYLLRRQDYVSLSAAPRFSFLSKAATGSIANEGGNALLEYQITAVAGYGSTNSSSTLTLAQYRSLVDKGLPSASLDRAVFYDLLPRGARVVTSGAQAPKAANLGSGGPAPSVAVSVTNNYRNTDRQLVKIEVTSNLPAGQNVYGEMYYGKYSKASGALSGYSANIWVSVPFDDVPLVNSSVNTAAFQNPDAPLIGGNPGYITQCYSDTGTAPTLEDVKGADGRSVFYNLANTPGGPDASVKNTMYASTIVDIKNSVSYGDGLANSVKTDKFIDESLYSSSTTVLTGQPYLYRLSLISGTQQISNAILFDNFGQASVSGSESGWNGTFENIDLSNAIFKGIEPVVYYTTEEDAPYFTVDDITNNTIPPEWLTAEPPNKADVRGVAVDISHDTAGNAYAIPRAQSVSLYITMRAPSALPMPDAFTLAETDTEAIEYNQAAYYALVDGVAVDPAGTALSAPTVATKLVVPKLVKSNSPDDWVSQQDTITYTLSYTNETAETQPLKLSDTAPTDTTLAPASSGSALAGNPTLVVADAPVDNAATSDATTGAIEWTCTVPSGKTVVATYEVIVGLTAQGEIPNTASALIEDANTSTHVPFESNEVVNRVVPPLEKAVENGVNSADRANPGDTLTYTLKYVNKTNRDQKVVIADSAPAGTSLADGTGYPAATVDGTPVNDTASKTGDTITWTINPLRPNEELTVSFQVIVDPNAADGSVIKNIGMTYIDDAVVGIESNPVDTTVEVPIDPTPPPGPDPDDPTPPDPIDPDDPTPPPNPDPGNPDDPTADPSDPTEPETKPLPDAPSSAPVAGKPKSTVSAQTGDPLFLAIFACAFAATAALALAAVARRANRLSSKRK